LPIAVERDACPCFVDAHRDRRAVDFDTDDAR
jgi:hypothetical protein